MLHVPRRCAAGHLGGSMALTPVLGRMYIADLLIGCDQDFARSMLSDDRLKPRGVELKGFKCV